MSEYQIECISLSKLYKRNKEIFTGVEDINMRIRQNETVLIKGRSGTGKSTLLNLMCGLIQPSDGKIFIGDSCITELTDEALSKLLLNEIGIIFQNFNLLPTYTIYENIEIAIVPKNPNKEMLKEKIMFYLEEFNLKNKARQFPSELSIGQQQKVAIIRTLIKEPSIIFADEPTGSVDNETAAEILDHLSNLKKEKQKTLVLASHGNIPDKFADTVYTLESGRIHTNNN
jgi:putative ABC transport system ATP-binding protein